jgi:hypothetical protein
MFERDFDRRRGSRGGGLLIAAGDRSPDKYIPGCRAAVAAQFRACVAKLAGVVAPAHGRTADSTPPTSRRATNPAARTNWEITVRPSTARTEGRLLI